MLQSISRFLKDERGASAVEYGLIVGLIAVAIAVILQSVGFSLNGVFSSVNDKLGTASGG